MEDFKKYQSNHFKGSASSYAGQGICSICKERYAEWTRANKAYCQKCKQRIENK